MKGAVACVCAAAAGGRSRPLTHGSGRTPPAAAARAVDALCPHFISPRPRCPPPQKLRCPPPPPPIGVQSSLTAGKTPVQTGETRTGEELFACTFSFAQRVEHGCQPSSPAATGRSTCRVHLGHQPGEPRCWIFSLRNPETTPISRIESAPTCMQNKDSFGYYATEHFRLSGVYWGVTALQLVGKLDLMDRDEVVEWVLSCRHANSGFGGSERHDPHLLYTLSALQLLALYDQLHLVDADATAKCEQHGVALALCVSRPPPHPCRWGGRPKPPGLCAVQTWPTCSSLTGRSGGTSGARPTRGSPTALSAASGWSTAWGRPTCKRQQSMCRGAAILTEASAAPQVGSRPPQMASPVSGCCRCI
jgi:hypothetical protein